MNIPASIDIRKKAKKSIDKADDTTVKMILAMLEVKEKEIAGNVPEYEDKIQRRFDEYEQGKIIPLTLSEFESGVKAFEKKRKSAK